MAAGWVHETLDLIAFGRIYRHVHQKKDAESQRTPGLRHREVGHGWYLDFQKLWDFPDPFPDWLKETIQSLKETEGAGVAEEQMVSDAHDYLDRVWNDLPKAGRNYWEGFFAWLLYNQEGLKDWAGVDVLSGRIHRTIEGQKMWEDSPETTCEYKRLRHDVSRHKKGSLRNVLARYGQKKI
jgi:hypothetical protein